MSFDLPGIAWQAALLTGALGGVWAAVGRLRDRKRARAALARVDLAASSVIATCNAVARAHAGPTLVADVTLTFADGGVDGREAFERAVNAAAAHRAEAVRLFRQPIADGARA